MSIAASSDFGRLGPVVGRANHTVFITTAVLGVMIWFAIACGTWLTLFALDNLLKLPAALRFPLSIAGVILTVWSLWKYAITSIRRRWTNEQVALMLEKRYGIRENVLINAMQFEEMAYGERQKDFVLETAKAGALGMKSIPLSELWQYGRMTAWGVVFAVLLSLSAVYVLMLPRYAGNAFYRYLHSLSDVPPAGSVSLDITPGQDVTIAEHETLRISLVVGRLEGNDKLMAYPELFYKEGEGTVSGQRGDGTAATMQPVVGKANAYTYVFENVRHSFAFRVFVRDTYTRSIQVTVSPAPEIVESRFTITPPAYVAQETREEAGPPQSVKCLPKSKLGIEVKLNKAAEKLRWLWPAGEVDFEKTGALTWKAKVEVGDTSGTYDVEVKVKDMEKPVRIATGSVLLLTDRKPDVRFVGTAMSRIVMPGDRLALQIEAEDDYGIGELEVTSRPAYGGSLPVTVRDWKYGVAPGKRGKMEEKFELTIDASIFVPGRQYFLEGRANDFCPDTPWGVSEPILITVKVLDALATSDADLARLYEALELAIRLQKEALDGTRNLVSNIDNVWVDMNRAPRKDDEIQGLLDKYREAILGKQRGVREALLRGVQVATTQEKRMSGRMKEIAELEAMDANDRAFSSVRRPFNAGELKPAAEDVFSGPQAAASTAGFDSRKGRYVGFMVMSPRGWEDKTWIAKLSLLDAGRKPLDTSGWKVLSARGGTHAEAQKALDANGWAATGQFPYFIVADMGAEHDVTGITLAGHDSQQTPKAFRLYVSTGNPPAIVPGSPDKSVITSDLGLLQRVQESIYNQLLALKGREAAEIAKKEDKEVKKALGEDSLEQAPTVSDKLNDFRNKLKEWTADHEKNVEKRKAIMDKPPQDFSDADRKNLANLMQEKLKKAREIKDWVDDLADAGIMDFADPAQIKISEVLRKANELKDLAALAAEPSKVDFSWNMDTLMTQKAKEIISMGPQWAVAGEERGTAESREDKGAAPKIPALPAELPLLIPDLKKALGELKPEVEQAGMAMLDTTDPGGSPMDDKYSSMAATGKMGPRSIDPKKKATGRSSLGRSGQADGQMVANKAPPVKDDEVAMPNRMSNSPREEGEVDDQGDQPATSVGLSKPGSKATDFAKVGRLPPDELRKMRMFMGQTGEVRENIRELMLALNRHNLPTTDLKRALERLEQIDLAIKNGDGVGIRRVFDAAVGYVDNAGDAVARAMELRQRDLAEEKKKRAMDTGGHAERIPEGYEDIARAYFKRLAEESTSLK